MAWLIPVLLVAAAVFFWALSRRATDELVAWCRFLLAGFLMLLAVVAGLVMLVG